MTLIEGYIFSLLVSGNIMFAWFETPFSTKVLSRLLMLDRYECLTMSFDSMISKLDQKSPFLADLLSCPICLGTWISLFVALFFSMYVHEPVALIIASTFSCPLLAYKFLVSK